MYRMRPLKLIKYPCDFDPKTVGGGCTNAGQYKAELNMRRFVSKQPHNRDWYCHGKMLFGVFLRIQ